MAELVKQRDQLLAEIKAASFLNAAQGDLDDELEIFMEQNK